MPAALSSVAALVLVGIGLAIAYSGVLLKLVGDWATNENYSHGFLVAPVAVYLAWERRATLNRLAQRPSPAGVIVILLGVGLLVAGVLGAELFLTRVSFVVVLSGSILFLLGWEHVRALAFPLAFLLLMIPIPSVVFNQIAFPLQIVASKFGETVLWLWGIPVLREGNLITLASTTLEVAEACSGVRSLVSLLTLGILYGHFVESRPLVRILLAIAAVAVTIPANGLRVAAIGIAVHYMGPQAAEGWFHTASAWLVFASACGFLLGLHRLIRQDDPAQIEPRAADAAPATQPVLVGSRPQLLRAALVCMVLVGGNVLLARASQFEPVLLREPLASIPLTFEGWRGAPGTPIDERVLKVLGVDEYLNRTYYGASRLPTSLYVGYYRSQRSGESIHSPLNCMPGSGWEPVAHNVISVPLRDVDGERRVEINRLLVQKGTERHVVLYWYQSGGRIVANEYWLKAFTILGAIRTQRTDGAMVRVLAPVVTDERQAERDAMQFVQALFPRLAASLPPLTES
jgi:exosortase D (VPLPA-CTERM-specific)